MPWPFKVYAIDADTNKPLDPNVGRNMKVTYYDIKKKKNGNAAVVAHKSDAASGGNAGKKNEKKSNLESNGKNAQSELKKGGGHVSEQKADDKREANGEGGDNKDNPEVKQWSPDEDAKLKQLKASNTTWKAIAEELGRPQWQLKARFKEIKDDDNVAVGADAGDDKKTKDAWDGKNKTGTRRDSNKNGVGDDKNMNGAQDEGNVNKATDGAAQKDKANACAAKTDKKKSKPEKHVEGTPAKAAATVASGRKGGARFTMKEWTALQEDDMFTFGELQCLMDLLRRDSSQTWLRVAAAFYDKTGRRVHPHDIKDKFAEMDNVG